MEALLSQGEKPGNQDDSAEQDMVDIMSPLFAHLLEAEAALKSEGIAYPTARSNKQPTEGGHAHDKTAHCLADPALTSLPGDLAPRSVAVPDALRMCPAPGITRAVAMRDTDRPANCDGHDTPHNEGFRGATGANAIPLQKRHTVHGSLTSHHEHTITPNRLPHFTRSTEDLVSTHFTHLPEGVHHELLGGEPGAVVRRPSSFITARKQKFSDDLWKLAGQGLGVETKARKDQQHGKTERQSPHQQNDTEIDHNPALDPPYVTKTALIPERLAAQGKALSEHTFCIRVPCHRQRPDDRYFDEVRLTNLDYRRFLYETVWRNGSIRLILTSPPQEGTGRLLLRGFRKAGRKVRFWILGFPSSVRSEPGAMDIVLDHDNAANARLFLEAAKQIESRKSLLRDMWISGNRGRQYELGQKEAHETLPDKVARLVDEICLHVRILTVGDDGQVDRYRDDDAIVLRRLLLSRGLEVPSGGSTKYVERYINVSTGETVRKVPGDIVLTESDHSCRRLFHFIVKLYEDRVDEAEQKVKGNEIGNKRDRSTTDQVEPTTKRPRL